MTYEQVVSKLGLQQVCLGGCGLSPRAHRGSIFLGVIHWRERKVTKRGLRRLLLLIAKRDRLSPNPEPSLPTRGALGLPWYNFWWDESFANVLASFLGIRFPVAYSAPERRACLFLAPRGLSRAHPAIYRWAYRGETA